MQLMQQTAVQGFATMTNRTNAALWDFSWVPGSTEYRELVPFGAFLTPVGSTPRLAALTAAINGLHPGGYTPLYDTVYAAFHAEQQHWQPNQTNAVLLITDGANQFDRGLTLTQLLDKLGREQRADRPVQITCLAVGADADAGALRQISQVTGGRTFVARDPAAAVQTLVLAFAGRLQ
jgi:Ca-activated chloride channel family protein